MSELSVMDIANDNRIRITVIEWPVGPKSMIETCLKNITAQHYVIIFRKVDRVLTLPSCGQ